METVLQIEQNKNLLGGLGDLLAFVGLPSKRSARELSVSSEELFKNIAVVLDRLLLRAIEQRTGAEFKATRGDVFGDYLKTVNALSNLVRVIVPARTIDVLVWESFSELEADLREQGLIRFGTAAKDQAIFTVWTLRKISRLLSKIAAAGPPSAAMKVADAKLAVEFSFCVAWTQFHLDCLMASIRFDKAINPEVLAEISLELRAVVNAYGLIRQGVELRLPSDEPTLAPIIWDDEDQALLDSSMADLEAEAS
jgi:hypothetical protein